MERTRLITMTNLTEKNEGTDYYIQFNKIRYKAGEVSTFVAHHTGTYTFMGLIYTENDVFYEFKNKDKGKFYLRRLSTDEDIHFCTNIDIYNTNGNGDNIVVPATINRILSAEYTQNNNQLSTCEMLLCNVFEMYKVIRYR